MFILQPTADSARLNSNERQYSSLFFVRSLFSLCLYIFSTEGRTRFVSEPSLANNTEEEDSEIQYKRVQKGGEIPLRGLQKPAPDKSSKYFIFAADIIVSFFLPHPLCSVFSEPSFYPTHPV